MLRGLLLFLAHVTSIPGSCLLAEIAPASGAQVSSRVDATLKILPRIFRLGFNPSPDRTILIWDNTLLRLRGGSRRAGDLQFSKKKIYSEQGRALAKQKRSWRERFGDSDSDDLSHEEIVDSDRPDFYKRPVPAPPADDFSRSGLPAWLDPIYDDVEPDEYLKAEVQDEDGEENPLGWEADIDSSDLLEEGIDPNTGEPTLISKPLPGDEFYPDKEFTISELEELERIWNWNERNFGKSYRISEESSEESQGIAALPWEDDTPKEDQLIVETQEDLLALDRLPVFYAQPSDSRLALENIRQNASAEGQGRERGGELLDPSSEGPQTPVALVAQEEDERPALNYTAMVEHAQLYAHRYRAGAVTVRVQLPALSAA